MEEVTNEMEKNLFPERNMKNFLKKMGRSL